jgi:hypothetical protein
MTVLNVHAPTKDKTGDMMDTFYDELERVFDKFPKYHMNMLGDISDKVGKSFSNKQLGMKFYTKLVLILELE